MKPKNPIHHKEWCMSKICHKILAGTFEHQRTIGNVGAINLWYKQGHISEENYLQLTKSENGIFDDNILFFNMSRILYKIAKESGNDYSKFLYNQRFCRYGLQIKIKQKRCYSRPKN